MQQSGYQFTTDEIHNNNSFSNREILGGLQSSNSGTLKQPTAILDPASAVSGASVMVIPPARIQFQTSE